jgi:phenylacetate-CoA ligase
MRILREQLFFGLQRAIGSRAGHEYDLLKTMATWSRDQLLHWQQTQCKELLNHAVRHVPFYRNNPRLQTTRELTNVPIITKSSLSGHYQDLMSDTMRRAYASGKPQGYAWLEVTSGGTTGLPTTVIHDADFRDKDRAARAYEQLLCGFPFGTPHIRLWGSMHDIQKTRASRQARIMSALSGEVLLNAFQMEDDHIRSYLTIINNSRIDFMIAYVDAIQQIARFARRHHISVRPLTAIMTTGGTLTEDARTEIREVFHARVHNKYGSRDAGEIACECAHGGLHVLPHILAEVVDEHGNPAPTGATGRLIITFLGNASFPLIRYDITDMASLSDTSCPCGSPFPMLDRLEGRATDFLFSSAGGFVSPVYIRHVVGVVHGKGKIKRFQLVQSSAVDYSLALLPETGVNAQDLEPLKQPLLTDLKAVLGETARIDMQVVDSIPETSGGKFRYIINRYRTS